MATLSDDMKKQLASVSKQDTVTHIRVTKDGLVVERVKREPKQVDICIFSV